MHLLAKHAAEIALRLAVVPADRQRCDAKTLTEIEELAHLILREVSAIRMTEHQPVGEKRGMWEVVVPRVL